MPARLFNLHEQQFAAPNSAVVAKACAVKAERQRRAVVAVFCQHGGGMGGVVLQAPQGYALAPGAGFCVAGGKKIWMRVAHQRPWPHLKQAFEVGGDFFIKSQGGGVFEIADVLAHKGLASARQAYGCFELCPGSQHAGGVLFRLRQKNRAGHIPTRTPVEQRF